MVERTPLTAPDGTQASPFCFGAMQFGGRASDTDSREMYDASRAAGVNFFDTAYVYTDGASETMLGQYAAHERDQLIIATKASYRGGGSRENILTTFDESRSRLNMDMVDLLYMHRFDANTPLEETFETLAELKADAKIRYIGISNYAAWQVVKAVHVAAQFGVTVDVLQPMYNLVKRQAEVEILPACADQGVSVCPYSPLGGGLLTGKYAGDGGGRLLEDDRYKARYGVEWMHQAAAALPALADKHETTAATLAVAWVARNPLVAHPIISARDARQLAPSLDALDFVMSDDLYAEMAALTVTPAPPTDRLEEA
jgi:aryl-alcohol dehydrogenase-like predicted oxidoreductase